MTTSNEVQLSAAEVATVDATARDCAAAAQVWFDRITTPLGDDREARERWGDAAEWLAGVMHAEGIGREEDPELECMASVVDQDVVAELEARLIWTLRGRLTGIVGGTTPPRGVVIDTALARACAAIDRGEV